jgi:hypothetical protein
LADGTSPSSGNLTLDDDCGCNANNTYNSHDFDPGGQGENNGQTLVIFQVGGTICLTATPDGRQFGPSVLAPFAHVVVKGDAGYVDGFIVAKSFETCGSNAGQLQLHGDGYRGPLCPPAPAPTPFSTTTASATITSTTETGIAADTNTTESSPQICAFPWAEDNYTITDFSLITLGNASVGSHNQYKGFAIGGTLSDSTPGESGNVCSHYSNLDMPSGKACHSWVGAVDTGADAWHWHGSGLTMSGASNWTDYYWTDLEALALGAKSFQDSDNGFRVQVVTAVGDRERGQEPPESQHQENPEPDLISSAEFASGAASAMPRRSRGLRNINIEIWELCVLLGVALQLQALW